MHARETAPAADGADTRLDYYGAAPSHEVNVDQKRAFPSHNWLYLLAIALAVATMGCGIYQVIDSNEGWPMVAAGCLGLIGVLATWPIVAALTASRSALANERQELLTPLTQRIDEMSILVNLISEQQLLSDRAKSVVFREKDRDALRRAISEEIAKCDWEAALVLADEMERGFGYKAEAEKVRQQVQQCRQDAIRRQVSDAIGTVDRHMRAEQWSAAIREAERLMQQFPDSEQVRNLPVEIENRRQAHKRQLLSSWTDAVARHDVDGSIEILRQLDTYLTPAEAESMQETARSVFKEKLNNLGRQFSAAVQEHRWAEAIRAGEAVMREFPNSRIAQEVRENMEALRQRAAAPAEPAAAATA